jgi:hypothetical protein
MCITTGRDHLIDQSTVDVSVSRLKGMGGRPAHLAGLGLPRPEAHGGDGEAVVELERPRSVHFRAAGDEMGCA